MAAVTWWPTVVLGGPVRPTGAVMLTRSAEDGSVTVHAAERLDSSGASEDEQAAAFSAWVRTIPHGEPAMVILARTAGVGRDIERCWHDALPRCQVRTFPLPTGDESARAREDLVAALHLIRSRRMFRASDTVNAAVDTYVRQDPAPYGETLNPHDADPDGIAVPVALAVRYSDQSRQTTIHAATDVRLNRRAIDRSRWNSRPYVPESGVMVESLPAIIAEAERQAGFGAVRGPRIHRRSSRPE